MLTLAAEPNHDLAVEQGEDYLSVDQNFFASPKLLHLAVLLARRQFLQVTCLMFADESSPPKIPQATAGMYAMNFTIKCTFGFFT